MKNLLFCLIGSLVVGWVLPWWTIFFVGVLAPLFFGGSVIKNFSFCFLGTFIGWLVLSWVIDFQNAGILSQRMAEMLGLPSGTLLLFVSSFMGGLICGIGGIFGAMLKKDYFNQS